MPCESVTFVDTFVIAASVGFKLQVQSGGSARWVRFMRARLGGEVPEAEVNFATGYGRDDEERGQLVGPDIFTSAGGLLRGRGGVGVAAAVEVEAGATLRQSGVLHVRGSACSVGGVSLVTRGGRGEGSVAGRAVGLPGAVVQSFDFRDVRLADVRGVGVTMRTGKGADVTGVRFVNVVVTSPRERSLHAAGYDVSNYTDLLGDHGTGRSDISESERSVANVEAIATIEQRHENMESLAALLGGDGEDVDWYSKVDDWDDRTATGDGEYVLNKDGERMMLTPNPPPPAQGFDQEVAARVSCGGQALGAQDDVSVPRLPVGCLMRDADIFD